MENQEHQEFDADAAFEEAAQSLETSGELTATEKPLDAEETTKDTPDQREDGQEQPKKEVEDDLPEWLANASDEVKENFRNLEADKKRYQQNARSQIGRVGALNKKYQQKQAENERLLAEIEQLKQQSKPQFAGELDQLREDYPEVAAVFDKLLAHQNQRLEDISRPLNSIAEANMRDLAQQELDNGIHYVTQLIPDAEQILSDPQFTNWLNQQTPGIQSMFSSSDPNDAVYLLKEYKNAVSANAERRAKQAQQLSATTLPTGRNTPKGGEEVDENALFDQIAAQLDKQRFR
ncbi:hypothetical protein M8982_07610 [Pasteurella multocida]|uniref:hypothetical protein n=1 Tax=Pasteurella multocida TaxID=747 RepID=UPI002021310D|nr:hypothetical protein [Pasteurella multocida]MCL7793523.1 hypothetical protein [Pasteurella multocida]HDR1352103.1 hypothetical protein [Pasteurella multocida]HDR1413869.1 hypothetical protein [Pasteurella multocida]HDR1452729.1 hypothetical protein [Pasteurella multocida]HDR1458903.1 hypothetical protein [Pasteurella multocida]